MYSKKVEKRFRCMLRYMRRKGVFDNRIRTWNDELSDKYRFVVWSARNNIIRGRESI